MLRLCVMLILLTAFNTAFSQVDTEFWFAPPEITAGHGDQPIFLRISTLDRSANVTVVQPARQNATVGSLFIPKNSIQTIDLTESIGNLETILPATVMKTGIRIIASSPIMAYYEIAAGANADIFALKGKNALGTRFVIPGQRFYNNDFSWSPTPTSSFDIVATRNNTTVTVRATRPLIGHMTGSEFTVVLNAGETYSFRKPTSSAEDNPVGTFVDSDKPIAITMKEDSIIPGGCADLIGDQLIPVDVAGNEYIALKGFLSNDEYVFITATEDDTQVFVDGDATPVASLSAGELYPHQLAAASAYITSNKTIYAFQITGLGCEVGLAILPSLRCNGSTQIGFSRTATEFFAVNLLVRKEGVAHFFLNGSSSLIPSTAFTPVDGTDDVWYQAQLTFSTTQLPEERPNVITNSSGSFQMGIIGCTEATCAYGYFSSFRSLSIGRDLELCAGAVTTLDAGPGAESYLWSTGQISEKIEVSSAGQYSVKVEREGCVLHDTVNIAIKNVELDLGPDIEMCPGDIARIDGKPNVTWQWSDGSTSRFLSTHHPGKYWVSALDQAGCHVSDTIGVSLRDAPQISLADSIYKCKEEKVFLDATFPDADYLWHDGFTLPSRTIHEEGSYSVKVTWNGCSDIEKILVTNYPGPPQDTIFGSRSVCPYVMEVDYRVEPYANSTYQWVVNGGQIKSIAAEAIKVDWHETNADAEVKVWITDAHGCKGDTIVFPVRINVLLLPETPLGPDTLCLNKSQQVAYYTPPTNGSVYQWNISGGQITSGQGSAEVLVTWQQGLNRLWIDETSTTIDTVCYGTSPELLVYVFEDTADATLNFASLDTTNDNHVNIDWSLINPQRIRDDNVLIYRRIADSEEWQLLTTAPTSSEAFVDDDLPASGMVDYYIALTNRCDEPVNTSVHRTMLLTGSADTNTDVISLEWNHYQGWAQGVDHYEVWRHLDHSPGFRPVAVVSGDEKTFSGPLGADGFQQRFVIRAIEKSGTNESWSSQVKFDFKHEVTIPNIITPNGDEYNQFFHIKKIELYVNSELTVLDRWGREVFHTVHYNNDWEGEGLSSGVYYYVLDLGRGNKIFKGTVSILR